MAKDYIEQQIGLIFSSEGISGIIDGLDKIKKKVDNINKGGGRGGGRGGFGNLMTGAAKAASGVKGLNKIVGGFGKTMKGGLGINVATTLLKKFTNAVITGSEFLYKYDKALVSISARAISFGKSITTIESSLGKTSKATSLTRMETMELFKNYQKSMRFASLEQFDKMMRVIQNTVGTNVEEMEEMKSTIISLAETYPVLADMAARMSNLSGEQVENYREMLNIARYSGDIGRKEYVNLLGMVNANKFLTESEKKRLEYGKEYLKDIGTVKRFFEGIKMVFGDIGKAMVTGAIPTKAEVEAEKETGVWRDLDLALEDRTKTIPTKGRAWGGAGPSYMPSGYAQKTVTIKPGEEGYWKDEAEKEEHERAKIALLAERTALYDSDDLMFRKLINTEIDKAVVAQKSFNIASIESMAITGKIDYSTINKDIEETISLIDSQVVSKRKVLDILRKNKTPQLEELLNNNEILKTDKKIYDEMRKRGESQVSDAKNRALQKDLEKDIVAAEKEKLKVSLSVLKVREYTTKVVQNEADLASKMVQLADNYAIGIGASMDMRLKEYNQLTKVIQEHEKNLQQVRIRRALDTDNLALKAEELELQKKIMDVTLQQAGAVKSMRSGWVEAVAALNSGMGIFTEIIMSAEKGTSQAARLKGIVFSPYSGAYGKGYGYDTSEKFSPYQEFGVGGGRRRGVGGRRFDTPYPMLGEGGIIDLERGEIGRVGRRIRGQSRRAIERGGTGLSVFGGHRFLGESYFERSRPGAQAIPSQDIERIRAEARKDGYNMARDIQKSYLEGFRVGTVTA